MNNNSNNNNDNNDFLPSKFAKLESKSQTTEKNSVSFIEPLPNELIAHCFEYVDNNDFRSLYNVCTQWLDIFRTYPSAWINRGFCINRTTFQLSCQANISKKEFLRIRKVFLLLPLLKIEAINQLNQPRIIPLNPNQLLYSLLNLPNLTSLDLVVETSSWFPYIALYCSKLKILRVSGPFLSQDSESSLLTHLSTLLSLQYLDTLALYRVSTIPFVFLQSCFSELATCKLQFLILHDCSFDEVTNAVIL